MRLAALPLLLAPLFIAPLASAATNLSVCTEASPEGFDVVQYNSLTTTNASADVLMNRLVDYDATAGNCKDPQDSVSKPCSSFIGHTFHSTTSCPCVSVTDSAYQ